MYEVYAVNHANTVTFKEYYLEHKLALDTFVIATKAVDCKSAYICNALTGELIAEYDYTKGKINWEK